MEEVNINELELGVVLYEKSNAKSTYDAPTGKVGAKGWAQRIYMLLLGAGLIGWFVYSLVTAANQNGFVEALLQHVAAFFVLFVCELILMLSAFGGWGKFTRFAMKHQALTRQYGAEGARNRQLEEEIRTADANKTRENAIRVYREYVVIVNNGEGTTVRQADLRNVRCNAQPQGYQLTFELYNGSEIVANMLLPVSDLPIVKKHFERFEYTPAERTKGYLRKKFPLLAFMCIPVIIGIVLIIIHCLVLPEMPLIFGIVFAVVGVILVIAQFSDVAVIKHGILPIGFGLVLTALPLSIMFTLADLTELTVASMLSTFTPVHAGLGLFLGLGPMLIIVGIAGLVDCARM